MNSREYIKHNWGNSYKCSLPEEIIIQLKTSDQMDIKLDLVLCSIYITVVDHQDCWTYHNIPTDANGQIKLTREDLIYNTELQFWFDDKLPLDDSLVLFDIRVTPQEFIRYFNHSAYNEDKPIDKYRKNNKWSWHTARWIFFMESHESNSKIVEMCNNLMLNYDSDKSSVTGNWREAGKYRYDLVLQP